MSVHCKRCNGTGFLNIEDVPDNVDASDTDAVMLWLVDLNSRLDDIGGCSCHINPPCSFCEQSHNVQVCDCCGDGDGHYDIPGEHYNRGDPQGKYGPYQSNGGFCECH